MNVTIACHYADEARLNRCLLASLRPQLKCPRGASHSWVPHGPLGRCYDVCDGEDQLMLSTGCESLTADYAVTDRVAQRDVVVYVHEDVELPPGWLDALKAALMVLDEQDPEWGVLGVMGTGLTPEGRQYYVGHVRDTFEERFFSPPGILARVEAIDSLVIVKRKGVLAWDTNLPGSFTGGTAEDICLQARAEGRGVWAATIPTNHWCRDHVLDTNPTYQAMKAYLLAKWPDVRPIVTTAAVWA